MGWTDDPAREFGIGCGGALVWIAVFIGGTTLGVWLGLPIGWAIFLSLVAGVGAWFLTIGWLVQRFESLAERRR